MNLRQLPAALAAACALAAAVPAHAGLVKMSYTGQVTGYWSLPILQDDFPVGTAISMTLTYDDSFIGQPVSTYYLGMSPSISGTMTLGSSVYTLDTMRLSYFGYGPTIDDPSPNYGFHVSGTGPDTDDGEVFSGLGLNFGTGWPGSPTLIGFGDTNWQVASNGYLLIAGSTTHEFLNNPVPAPPTLALCLAGLCALACARRPAVAAV
jgi:hypothetical protein